MIFDGYEETEVMILPYKMLFISEENVDIRCGFSSHICNLKRYQKVTEHIDSLSPQKLVVILTVESELFNIQRLLKFSTHPCPQWYLEDYYWGQKEYIDNDKIDKKIHDPQFYINDLIGNVIGYLNRNYKES